MKDFATHARPLRPSSIPKLLQCPRSVVLRAEEPNMPGGKPAQTGSLIHLGIQAFHKIGSEAAALAVMSGAAGGFPLADQHKARKHFEHYARREQAEWGRVIECEQPVTVELPGADAGQAPVVIAGTLDQVRELPDGSLLVVDVKTGAPEAPVMLGEYTGQLMAYQFATIQRHPGRRVNAAILRTYDFLYGGKVLHRAGWSQEQIPGFLEFLVEIVAQVRAGRYVPLPGKHCVFCPATSYGHCAAGTVPDRPAMRQLPTIDDIL